jgi:hypothetical protein
MFAYGVVEMMFLQFFAENDVAKVIFAWLLVLMFKKKMGF